MKKKILSIIPPVPGHVAVFVHEDGTTHSSPVIAIALVETEDEAEPTLLDRFVEAIVADTDGIHCDPTEAVNFVMFTWAGCQTPEIIAENAKETLDRINRIEAAKNDAPKSSRSSLSIVPGST